MRSSTVHLSSRFLAGAAVLLVSAASSTALAQSCPDETPYACSDGFCYDVPCETVTSCPDSAPYECSDGNCYDVPCESVATCPSAVPYLCGDGYCYASSDCSPCPPGYPYDCGNEYCGSTEQACFDDSDTTPSTPGQTPDGTLGPGAASNGGEEVCSDIGTTYEGCASVQACCTMTSCRYLTDDGTSFYCDGADCYSAADETIAYCEDQTGCSASPGPVRGGLGSMMAFVALALGAAVRTAHGRRAAAFAARS